MLNQLIMRVGIVGVILSISACGLIKDRSNEYRSEAEGKPLKVPEGYESSRIDSRYPIPKVDHPTLTAEKFEVPASPSETVLGAEDPFAIERMDGQQWLWVNNTPGRAWPMLDKFLRSRGMDVAFENIELGLVQSSVLQAGKLSEEYYKSLGNELDGMHVLQFKLSQGVKRNSSEVQVRLAAVNAMSVGFLPWNAQSSSTEQELQVLKDLKLYMESKQDDKTFSLVAQEMGGPSKVTLVSSEDSAHLKFDIDYDRSWGVVTRSLRDARIQVIDRDRSKGLFYIIYSEPQEASLWTKLFSSTSEQKTPNFLLKLEANGAIVVLGVTGVDGQQIDKDTKVKLLSLLLENVS